MITSTKFIFIATAFLTAILLPLFANNSTSTYAAMTVFMLYSAATAKSVKLIPVKISE